MSGSISNNSVAWAVNTSMPTGSFRALGWFKISSATIAENSYQTMFEVGWSGGFQRIAFDPFENNIYWAGNGYGVIGPQATFENVWVRFLFWREGDSWAIYWALPGDTSWTLTSSWSTSAANSYVSVFYSYADSNYLVTDGKVRSERIYTSGTLSELFTDSLSATPTLPNLWASWADGATPANLNVDYSGNGRNQTVTNTPVYSTDDPIAAPPPAAPTYGLFFGMGP